MSSSASPSWASSGHTTMRLVLRAKWLCEDCGTVSFHLGPLPSIDSSVQYLAAPLSLLQLAFTELVPLFMLLVLLGTCRHRGSWRQT